MPLPSSPPHPKTMKTSKAPRSLFKRHLLPYRHFPILEQNFHLQKLRLHRLLPILPFLPYMILLRSPNCNRVASQWLKPPTAPLPAAHHWSWALEERRSKAMLRQMLVKLRWSASYSLNRMRNRVPPRKILRSKKRQGWTLGLMEMWAMVTRKRAVKVAYSTLD